MDYESLSEKHGIEFMRDEDTNILSVGISTGGQAEIKMVANNPDRRVIATTLDIEGVEKAKRLIGEAGLSDQIESRVENVAEPLPYEEAYFDYVYARLVLHYLSKEELRVALEGLSRVTKLGGGLFVVVRSDKSDEAMQPDNIYDNETGLTTYKTLSGHQATRYFHNIDSIGSALVRAGYSLEKTRQYDEMLNASFDRSGLWVKNNVIEILGRKYHG